MQKNGFTCGLEAAVYLIGAKWKLLILFHIGDNSRRLGELRRLIGGVSEKVLIQQLKELVAHGILSRHDFHTVPPHVEYRMTDFGRSLGSALRPLCAWGTEHIAEIEKIRNEQ